VESIPFLAVDRELLFISLPAPGIGVLRQVAEVFAKVFSSAASRNSTTSGERRTS